MKFIHNREKYMPDIRLKRKGYGLPIKTFESGDGKSTYIVFKQPDGSYHTFVEVEAKDAAMHCGSQLDRTEITRKHWDTLWESDES
ncbi:hypothetical protein [Bacterioplanoides sp. SCSIO 12839]|uniref:hypothetical protein n=1 Tax=Bacterioplanoides sp. SCSIO 12839 TaxID=2829569 RepID=UPI0021066B8E|nr:hypothetical protein [Bacterioplanoides sp. SCSIO 12839]UTW47127.1 hypothetical protein KFF03_11055 [Bacterioplanoides sp. SCSIO 12839]